MKKIYTRLAIWAVTLCSLCAFLVPTASASEPSPSGLSEMAESLIDIPTAEAVDDAGGENGWDGSVPSLGEDAFVGGEALGASQGLPEVLWEQTDFGGEESDTWLGQEFPEGEGDREGEGIVDEGFTSDLAGALAAGAVPSHRRVRIPLLPLPRASGEEVSPTDVVSSFPGYYDTRRLYSSPVKNQDPYGMCWAFAMVGCAETYLMKSGKMDQPLSEEHLAYFLAYREVDPLGNTEGDKNEYLVDDAQAYHDAGMSTINASIFLSTWSGFALESLLPYPTDETHTEIFETTAKPEMAYDTSVYLREAVFSSVDSVERYKRLITEYGSVSVGILMDERYYNAEHYSYSNHTAEVIDHTVVLVGWDDSYPAENFLEECGVVNDGAFIVKNSWGSDWGDQGYFYISYDCMLRNAVALDVTDDPAYPNNYFYDGASALVWSSIEPGGGAAFANVFKVKAAQGHCEALGEVVLTDYSDSSDYLIQVYTNLEDPTDPNSGTPAFPQPLSYHKTYAGVGTFSLPREVILAPDSYFSVVVRNGGSEMIMICVDQTNIMDNVLYQAATKAGECFWQSDAGAPWVDIGAQGSFTARIKAHTRSLNLKPGITGSLADKKLQVGEETQMRAEVTGGLEAYRISFSSSDPYVARVTEDGTVRTVGAGKAVITAKVLGTNLSVQANLTVKGLPAPENVALTAVDYKAMKLTWDPLERAAGYAIYRRVDGKWKVLGYTEDTFYTDAKVTLGKAYGYRVKGYLTVYTGADVMGSACKTLEGTPVMGQPSKVKVKAKTYGNVVEWKAVGGASGYVLYRNKDSEGFALVAKLNGKTLSYKDQEVEKGSHYTYKVKAYRKVSGVKYYGKAKSSSSVEAVKE